jgi:hypothetical protein
MIALQPRFPEASSSSSRSCATCVLSYRLTSVWMAEAQLAEESGTPPGHLASLRRIVQAAHPTCSQWDEIAF